MILSHTLCMESEVTVQHVWKHALCRHVPQKLNYRGGRGGRGGVTLIQTKQKRAGRVQRNKDYSQGQNRNNTFQSDAPAGRIFFFGELT